MSKVLIPTKLDKAAAKLLQEKGFTVVQDAEKKLPALAAENPETSVIIVRSEKVTSDIIDALPKLRLIVRAGAGYDNIDTKHARKKSVDVMNTPGANSNAVAEEVIALWLAAYRYIVPGDSTTRQGQWEKSKYMGRELTGKTLGVVGLGSIGRLVVKRLQGFDIKFLGYDPVISADYAEKMGVQLCSIEEIFEKADCVTLHIPENKDTKGMINRSLLGRMKKGAVLVNCARAGVINEGDLREVKKEKGLFFCNDVYPKDEAGPKTVADIADIMVPHIGANTHEANFNAAMRAAEQTVDYFEKGVTTCVVNKGVPDGLDECYQQLASAIARLARSYLGREAAPHQIETSFYGSLKKYSKWLLAPITSGLCAEFDPFLDASDAEDFLKRRGIVVVNREVDEGKGYGEAMTIDLFEGSTSISKVSIRGTITEGNLMISRVNNFDKLYFEPSGNNLFVEYTDEPGVIAKISKVLGDNGININDIRAPQDPARKNAMCVLKTNAPVSQELVDKIKVAVKAKVAFAYSC